MNIPEYKQPISLEKLHRLALDTDRAYLSLKLYRAVNHHGRAKDVFVSDGCSKWPDRWIRGEDLYESCFWHDVAYFLGGQDTDRKIADKRLREDIAAASNWRLAWLMWAGVRIGGSPYFKRFPWRWGYGDVRSNG